MLNEKRGTLDEVFVLSTVKSPGRRVWKLYPESSRPSWATIFLDAELYIEGIKAVPVLQQLQESGTIPPTIAVFVSSSGAVARHSDYVCDPHYEAFLSQDVVPWVLSDHADVEGRVVIAGVSLSGLAAAHAALTHSDQFRGAICQSPSFWWNDERLRSSLPTVANSRQAFWISVGNQETGHSVSHPPSGLLQQSSQIDACQRVCEALTASKYHVNYRVFQGGHDPECWRDDLVLALPWLRSQHDK
jgi:enterochelin esterase-like enzyme